MVRALQAVVHEDATPDDAARELSGAVPVDV